MDNDNKNEEVGCLTGCAAVLLIWLFISSTISFVITIAFILIGKTEEPFYIFLITQLLLHLPILLIFALKYIIVLPFAYYKKKTALSSSPLKQMKQFGFKEESGNLVGQYKGCYMNLGWSLQDKKHKDYVYILRFYYQNPTDKQLKELDNIYMSSKRVVILYRYATINLGYRLFRPSSEHLMKQIDIMIEYLNDLEIDLSVDDVEINHIESTSIVDFQMITEKIWI